MPFPTNCLHKRCLNIKRSLHDVEYDVPPKYPSIHSFVYKQLSSNMQTKRSIDAMVLRFFSARFNLPKFKWFSPFKLWTNEEIEFNDETNPAPSARKRWEIISEFRLINVFMCGTIVCMNVTDRNRLAFASSETTKYQLPNGQNYYMFNINSKNHLNFKRPQQWMQTNIPYLSWLVMSWVRSKK